MIFQKPYKNSFAQRPELIERFLLGKVDYHNPSHRLTVNTDRKTEGLLKDGRALTVLAGKSNDGFEVDVKQKFMKANELLVFPHSNR